MQTQATEQLSRLIIGLGQTGLSVARYLAEKKQPFKVMDTRHDAPGAEELERIKPGALIPWNGEQMLGYDQLVVSPGIAITHPDIAHAKDFGVDVIGDIELFAQNNNLPVIAITGSNGKSTVTELVGLMITASGAKSLVGGNIGVPALDLVSLHDEDATVVLELSSFQLETTYSLKPIAATILNVSEDHLDRYVDYKAYIEAKQRIFNHAQTIVVNHNDENTQPEDHKKLSNFGFDPACDWQVDMQTSTLKGHGKSELDLRELGLKGAHNALNVAAAFALVEASGIEINADVIACAKRYKGMPHRSQLVAVKYGVTYINDSKATNVGATVAAIESFAPEFEKKIILIAGGDAKGADLDSLSESISRQVKTVICFGKDGNEIAKLDINKSIVVDDLKQAVEQAKESAEDGDCVLLSPACASLDMFKNYIERGEQFEQFVEAL